MPNFQGIHTPALAISGSGGKRCHLTRHVISPTSCLSSAINTQEHASRITLFCSLITVVLCTRTRPEQADPGNAAGVRHFGWMHTSQPISPPAVPRLT